MTCAPRAPGGRRWPPAWPARRRPRPPAAPSSSSRIAQPWTSARSGGAAACAPRRLSRSCGEDLVHPAPGEIAQQRGRAGRRHAGEAGVVPEARQPARLRHARLVRVDFPGVEVEDAAPALRAFTRRSAARNSAYGIRRNQPPPEHGRLRPAQARSVGHRQLDHAVRMRPVRRRAARPARRKGRAGPGKTEEL